jgi:hypothetical protein
VCKRADRSHLHNSLLQELGIELATVPGHVIINTPGQDVILEEVVIAK